MLEARFNTSDYAISRPAIFLRAEALCALLAACVAFHYWFPHHWISFACWFLLPDVTFVIYAVKPNAFASALYNLAHTYVFPFALAALAIAGRHGFLGRLSLIWIAHIGFDRVFGMGLKAANVPGWTHLQAVSPGCSRREGLQEMRGH